MLRRNFLASASALPALAQTTGGKPRNILLLIADDLGLHTGAYGDANARTPNLDKMASEGVRFSNAFCTTASCSASRSVILSGLYNHANGHYGHAHAEHHFSYLPFVKPLPALLKDAGYRTGVIGKLHVNPLDRFRWDMHGEGESRSVARVAERAKSFFQSAPDKPWYLHVGYADPHRAGGGLDFANKPYPGVKANPFDPAKIRMPAFLPDNPDARADVAQYYEAANRLDQGIGFMFDALRETGQLDNTLVVFISDNGMPFPNAKTNCYDAGMRLPMIAWSKSLSGKGRVNNGFVNWADLAPTFLDWAGAKGPDYKLHGRSFLPVIEEENPAGWDRSYFSHCFHEVTMYYPMRGVRTRQFRYIRNLFPDLEYPHASDLWASPTYQSALKQGDGGLIGSRPLKDYLRRPAEELYDVTADPDEVRNLAKNPEYRNVLTRLRGDVQQWRKETKDPWLINDTYSPLKS